MVFYQTTPLESILRKTGTMSDQDAIKKFLTYIQKTGLPKKPFFAFIHHMSPHAPHIYTETCEAAVVIKTGFKGYRDSYQCALRKIEDFMKIINVLDPEAIVVFQADHGWAGHDNNKTPNPDPTELKINRGKILNAIKAPDSCFEKYGAPKTTVNTIRFALNCSYGFDLPFRKNIHYRGFYESSPEYGSVVEQRIY